MCFRWFCLFNTLKLIWVINMQTSNQTSSNEANWLIIPTTTPQIIKHCSKCNKKMNYYCSEKFRLNGNHTRIDIWLIYKCVKCDTTWKLTIKKGIKPHDISQELFEKFTHNDKELAWQYAFNQQFLSQQACVVDYTGIEYNIDGFETYNGYDIIHLRSLYYFKLKLSALLSHAFCISVVKLGS